MTVTADSVLSNHHLSLYDGTNTLELILCDPNGMPNALGMVEEPYPQTALRVSQGSGGAGDYELPYTPSTQSDFGGGIGGDFFDKDATRYYDGYCCDTSTGKIYPAGEVSARLATETAAISGPTGSSVTANTSISFSFSTTGAVNMRRIAVLLTGKIVNNDRAGAVHQVSLKADSAGSPGATLATGWGRYVYTDYAGQRLTANITYNLAGTTRYWITFSTATWPYTNNGWSTGTAAGEKVIADGVTTNDKTCEFYVYTTQTDGVLFFEFRGQLYAVTQNSNESASRLLINGSRGMATSNASAMHTLIAGATVPTESGLSAPSISRYKSVKVVGGPGYNEAENYRKITDITSATITCASNWNIPHTTSTEYVVLGQNLWTLVTIGTTALTGPVSDVCVVDNNIYFCQGDVANVVCVVFNPATGAYTGSDEGYKRDFMEVFVDTDGKKRIISTVATTSRVYAAEIASGTTPLTWTDYNNALACGDANEKVNAIGIYDDPQRPWILKEGSFGSIKDKVYGPIPLGEMRSLRSGKNGRAWCQSNKYLYFGIGERVVRYYSGMLDDIGFTLPTTRKGVISALVSYPGGTVFAAVDAGLTGYSSVLRYNGRGWCEVYRAPVGVRITSLYVQNIEGCDYQKLWISASEMIVWIPISIKVEEGGGEFFCENRMESYIITSWYRTSFETLQKFWNSAMMLGKDGEQSVTLYYQTENQSSFVSLGNDWPVVHGDWAMSATKNIYGKKIRFKIVMEAVGMGPYTGQTYIETFKIDSVTRVPVKRSWRVQYRIEDYPDDLKGAQQSKTAASVRSQLRTWEDSRTRATPVLMRALNSLNDNIYVFVEPGSVRLLKYTVDPSNPERMIGVGQFTLVEA